MDQISTAEASAISEDIKITLTTLFGDARVKLQRVHGMLNIPGAEELILGKMGTTGADDLRAFAAFHQAVESLSPGVVPPLDPAVFIPHPDGSVEFVPPASIPQS